MKTKLTHARANVRDLHKAIERIMRHKHHTASDERGKEKSPPA